MAATSALARLGLRLGALGSAASLAIAAPVANGDLSMAGHTDANRVGVYFDRSTPADPFMGIVAGGIESLRVSKTKVDALTKLVTAASVAGGSGFNLTPGVAPTLPNNGDVWLTGVDAYARIGGVTRSIGDETYVSSVNSEATLNAAITAAEASGYKFAVITITTSINFTGGSPALTKDYTFVGTGSTGAGGGVRPTLTKGNGPWITTSGKNLTFINLIINSTLPQNFITVNPGVNVRFFGCNIAHSGGPFLYREYDGTMTAKFEKCTVAVSGGGALCHFAESNPANTNIPQGEILFDGCTLSGLMVKCDNAGKVNCSLVGSSLTDPGAGCWYATEFSAGRSALNVNYEGCNLFSTALAAGSTDTITFTNRSGSLRVTDSAITVTRATAGDVNVNVEAGTGATTARAILFLRGNVGDSTTGWFFIRNGTTIGSHLDLMYTPSANINDGANKHSIRFYTDGGIQVGGTYGTSPGASCLTLAGTYYALTDTLTDAATINYVATASDNFTLLLTSAVGGTRQLATPTALVSGMRWVIRVKQPVSGGPCALTFSSDYKFPFGSTPTLSTAADAIDMISCYYDGTVIVAQVVNSYGTVSGISITGTTLNIAGAVNFANELVTANTALDDTHYTVCVDASGGPITITLPDTATAKYRGRKYNIKKVDASVNAVTILRSGADVIDGATTAVLTVQYQVRTVHSRTLGGTWDII